jgi:hypothetical protein
MPTPRAGYYTEDGKRVPGTTTIIGRFKDSGGLIWWAWDLGMKGEDYKQVRDKAADAGSGTHAMVEADASGNDPEKALELFHEDIRASARMGFDAYREWKGTSKIEIVEQEMQLVSEEYKFGGTPDAIGYCNGKLSLLDWKTGAIYPDHLIQVAAYRQLWHENRPDDQLESFHLVRFNRDTAEFSHKMFNAASVDTGWEQFKLLRQAYELDKQIKKAVK